VTESAGGHTVMLSEAKHLNVSQGGEVEILRCAQDDTKGRLNCHGPRAWSLSTTYLPPSSDPLS
jgi:hypothetical protein